MCALVDERAALGAPLLSHDRDVAEDAHDGARVAAAAAGSSPFTRIWLFPILAASAYLADSIILYTGALRTFSGLATSMTIVFFYFQYEHSFRKWWQLLLYHGSIFLLVGVANFIHTLVAWDKDNFHEMIIMVIYLVADSLFVLAIWKRKHQNYTNVFVITQESVFAVIARIEILLTVLFPIYAKNRSLATAVLAFFLLIDVFREQYLNCGLNEKRLFWAFVCFALGALVTSLASNIEGGGRMQIAGYYLELVATVLLYRFIWWHMRGPDHVRPLQPHHRATVEALPKTYIFPLLACAIYAGDAAWQMSNASSHFAGLSSALTIVFSYFLYEHNFEGWRLFWYSSAIGALLTFGNICFIMHELHDKDYVLVAIAFGYLVLDIAFVACVAWYLHNGQRNGLRIDRKRLLDVLSRVEILLAILFPIYAKYDTTTSSSLAFFLLIDVYCEYYEYCSAWQKGLFWGFVGIATTALTSELAMFASSHTSAHTPRLISESGEFVAAVLLDLFILSHFYVPAAAVDPVGQAMLEYKCTMFCY